MTRTNLIQSAILAWIVTILLSIASGPMLKMCYSMEDYSNGLNVHKKLQNLNIISSDFGGFKNTTKQFFACLTSFLACVLGLNIIVTILTIFPQMFYRRILYAAVVFFSLFTAAFIGLTIWSVLLYVDLNDEQIDPYNETSDLHGQMISSLKDNFRSDNLTTGTKISNEWNHLFIDFECCGVNKVVGTLNDFDPTHWCTTEGSCHAASLQIPRTCCKGFTENDYQNAPIECKSSVTPGFYYEKGCFSVIMKEVIKERITFDSFTDEILIEGLKVILVMWTCSFLSLFGMCLFIGICLTKKDNAENEETSQTENESPRTEHLHPNYQRSSQIFTNHERINYDRPNNKYDRHWQDIRYSYRY